MSDANGLAEAHLAAASDVIAERIGLHFPKDRWIDLERRLRAAARDLGHDGPQACAELLIAGQLAPSEEEAVIGALTIGETYFFRDPAILAQLEEQVLAPLIASRRDHDRRLRIWSAGCSTGEEPYTLAMILSRMLPDLVDWHVTVLATDLNPRSLSRAAEGIYGDWSFRGTPRGLKERFFESLPDGRHRVNDAVRQLVTFAPLNLAEDSYPTLLGNTTAMDLIFCRNVLMYFHPALIARALGRLHAALNDDGWLIVSPSELALLHQTAFTPVVLPKTVLYRKCPPPPTPTVTPRPLATRRRRDHDAPLRSRAAAKVGDITAARLSAAASERAGRSATATLARADRLLQQGHYDDATQILQALLAEDRGNNARVRGRAAGLLARASANTGRLEAAATLCRQALDFDAKRSDLHYLLATVLIELERLDEAETSLRRALTLDDSLVVAHLALANVKRRQREFAEAETSYAQVLELLREYNHDDVLPQSDGMTAGRLSEIAAAMAQR